MAGRVAAGPDKAVGQASGKTAVAERRGGEQMAPALDLELLVREPAIVPAVPAWRRHPHEAERSVWLSADPRSIGRQSADRLQDAVRVAAAGPDLPQGGAEAQSALLAAHPGAPTALEARLQAAQQPTAGGGPKESGLAAAPPKE
jgi:hypothetical protein